MKPSAMTTSSDRADFAQSAHARLRALIDANWTTQAISVAVQLQLPEMMAGGAQPVERLAERTQCHEASLRRLLRALTSIDIVRQQPDGCFALTDTGRLLDTAAPHSMAAWAQLCGTSAWAAWGQLLGCVRTGASVRRRATGRDGFQHLEQDAEAASLFNRAMVGLSAPVAAAVAAEFDFSNARLVVDVGGGSGGLLVAVLAAHVHLCGVLLDMAHAVDAAQVRLVAAGVADRCKFVAGDFFESVPPDADLYLLKSVLHDWDDARCIDILRACARAMTPGARLLVIERVMPDQLSNTLHDQGIARGDLNMLIAQDGCERTLADYVALLRSAELELATVHILSVGFSVLSARVCDDLSGAHRP
jgi:orsellinic acid C2-O-methyltransferase